MSKLVVITAPNSSLTEERDAVEKEIQTRLGDRAFVVVLSEGWSLAEFDVGETMILNAGKSREPKTIASIMAEAKKRAGEML